MTTKQDNYYFWKEIKDHIVDWMNDNEGETLYACDMRSECTMAENYDGCWKVYTNNAWHFIADNIEEACDTFDYFKSELDMAINPFDSPTAYTFYMLDWGVGEMLNECDFFDRNWNNRIALTPGVIRNITNQLEHVHPTV